MLLKYKFSENLILRDLEGDDKFRVPSGHIIMNKNSNNKSKGVSWCNKASKVITQKSQSHHIRER